MRSHRVLFFGVFFSSITVSDHHHHQRDGIRFGSPGLRIEPADSGRRMVGDKLRDIMGPLVWTAVMDKIRSDRII